MNIIDKVADARFFKNKYVMIICMVIIGLYPLRWSFTGLDLWDTGYNCANFVYFDRHVIGETWFFSTFLSNALGHAFSYLPFCDTLAGLRIVCGLVISLNIFISAGFCRVRLKLSYPVILFGSILAVSLCYSPSAVLYNHLSFLLFNTVIILVYTGLVEDRLYCLFLGGFLLCLNVFARFSNLVQAALIIGVIYYLKISGKKLKDSLIRILACVGGYLSCALFMLIILSRYGVGDYFSGIMGLLASTGDAADYKPSSMIMRMFDSYMRGGRRIADMLIFALLAVILIKGIIKIRKGQQAEGTVRAVSVMAGVSLIVFLINRQLMQFDFHHYITVILTAAMFVDLALILLLLVLFSKERSSEDKLIAVLLILFTGIQSVGSNTAISPMMNSMFILGPVMTGELTKLIKKLTGDSFFGDRALYVKGAVQVLIMGLIAFYVQCLMFGGMYCYQEARNGAGGIYKVNGSRTLAGTRMDAEHADIMQAFTDYINERDLKGHGVLVYGYAPALPYCLGLEPVITTWPDLDSYNISQMERDMLRLEDRIRAQGEDFPVIILDEQGAKEQREHNPAKWEMISRFMEEYGYSPDFSRERFTVYTASGSR